MRISRIWVFLSRKSTPEEEPQAEQDQAPDSPVETIEPTPDESGGEIKISKGSPNGAPELDDDPVAPEPQGDDEAADDASDGESARLKAEELITPSRHGRSDEEEPEVKTAKVISFANQKGGVAKTTTRSILPSHSPSPAQGPLHRPRPAGQPDDEPGHRPDKVEKSMYDVLVHDIPMTEVIQKREIDIAVARSTSPAPRSR